MIQRSVTIVLIMGVLLCSQSLLFSFGADEQTENIIAMVNSEEVTEEEVLDEIQWIAQEQSERLNPALMAQKEIIFFPDARERAINYELTKQIAAEQGIEFDQQRYNESLQQIVGKFENDAQLDQALGQSGLSKAKLQIALKNKILFDQVMQENVDEPSPVSEKEIQAFYDENPDSFTQPAQVHAKHILLRFQPNTTEEQKQALNKQLQSIQQQIQSGETTFEAAAKQHSQDPGSAKNGGDLSYFSKGQMVPAFEEAAFSTPAGEITDIVESKFGYHLIKVVDKKEQNKVPLEQVSEKVKTYLEQQKRSEKVQAYVEDLREEAEIDVKVTIEDWKKRHAPEAKKPSGGIQIDPNELK